MRRLENVSFADLAGRKLLIALSGGADSVALTHLLAARRDADRLTLAAAHFNHRIRGSEADADEAFCRTLCQTLDIEFFCGSADVPAVAAVRGVGLETCARDLRYEFLRNTQTVCGADCIALAHHADDQAETVLMHLLRGTGPEGICGMARLQNGLYRPLLKVRHADLVAYLREIGADWREDATNAVADSPRNAIRLNVLPEIEKCYPMAAAALGRYAENARIESDFVERQTRAYLKTHLQSGAFGRRLLLETLPDEAILRRAIRSVCGANLNAAKLDELIALAKSVRGKTDIFTELSAERAPTAMYFLRKSVKIPEPVPFNPHGETALAGICRILAETGDFEIDRGDPYLETVDADALNGAVLRTRISGDRMRPLGMNGDKLLSDCMLDRHIDRPLRNVLPVIAVGNRILWALGIGIAEEIRIQPTTRRRVRLKIIDHIIHQSEANNEE